MNHTSLALVAVLAAAALVIGAVASQHLQEATTKGTNTTKKEIAAKQLQYR
jgi:hypothetical protein